MVKVSIVGSAGRRADLKKLNKTLYHRMIDKAKEVLTDVWKLQLDKVELVSGGAAWSDHVAVALYLQEEFHSLKLHFPAKWQASSVDPKFQSTGSECDDYLKNPGGVANRYHKLFSDKIKENSLLQIESAIALGATVREHKGFHERNTAVAQSPYLLAFTWGEGNEPKKGGTYNTWLQCKGTRLHIPLSSLVPDEKKSSFKTRKSPRKSPMKISRKLSFFKTREKGKITGYYAKKCSKSPIKMSPTTQS